MRLVHSPKKRSHRDEDLDVDVEDHDDDCDCEGCEDAASQRVTWTPPDDNPPPIAA
jgi:hypothetical protein